MQRLSDIYTSPEVWGFTNDVTVYFVPGFVLLIGLELYVSYRNKLKIHEPKDSLASIGMGIGSLVIGFGVKFVAFGFFLFLYQFDLLGLQQYLGIDKWYAWLILLVADDFSFYWHHRLSHHVRILWAAHINHHSSVNYNLAVALRQSWTEILYKYIFWMWLPLIGFHPIMIFTMMGISLLYQFWVHTKTIRSLGPLEWVLNTPSHHRVHHASNARYLDRNHAGILIIWDRMFGTFQKELDEDPPVYGITSNIHTYNLFKIAFHEFGNIMKDVSEAPDLKSKLAYIFAPPGWSHDGRSKTSDQLRAEKGIS
jgi:sterol desaturase/sphingolipid hydroxylase (fatty acid hydroxylase superfamily)